MQLWEQGVRLICPVVNLSTGLFVGQQSVGGKLRQLILDLARRCSGLACQLAQISVSIGVQEEPHQDLDARLGRDQSSKRCESVHLSIRSEEHTSELQSLMRISYAVFCLKKKKTLLHHSNIVIVRLITQTAFSRD